MATTSTSGDLLADRRAGYAEAYAAAGDYAAAAELMAQALERSPGWTLGRMRLAAFLEDTGARDDAVAIYREVLAEDPRDPLGAGLKLAALGAAAVPAAPPPLFVAGLFDQYAAGFDAQLVDRLDYRVPDALLALLQDVAGPAHRFGRVLDLGCGTGLMGERLRPAAGTLDGIDLSAGMLERARAKGLYDGLAEGDLLAARADGGLYDLAVAADVLTYLGDLRPVFRHAATLLRPGGLLAFSVEAADDARPFALRTSLRYAHAPDALAAELRAGGFGSVAIRRADLRRDRGEPVAGALIAAHRR